MHWNNLSLIVGSKKSTKIENIIGKHISRWYQLNKSLEMSLNFRTRNKSPVLNEWEDNNVTESLNEFNCKNI